MTPKQEKVTRARLVARISARCQQSLHTRVEDIASASGLDPADVIRMGLRFGLPIVEKKYRKLPFAA